MGFVDIDIRTNATLDLKNGDGSPISWSYEYVDGSTDSPYIITLSSTE
jgi:hypothetical protein